MGFKPYTEAFKTPSPHYPQPTQCSLDKLLWSWESLRKLDTEGYRTSYSKPGSTWLVKIDWGDGKHSGRSRGRGTTCSPFTTQSIAMALSDGSEPYTPKLSDGRGLPSLFSTLANSNLKWGRYAKVIKELGLDPRRDNGWVRSIIFFNLGYAVDPTEMRKGDAVKIHWLNGGGHAVFCWDVHLDANGKVDAFQYISSNGMIGKPLENGGSGRGVTVGGDFDFVKCVSKSPLRYEVRKSPLFVDDEKYVKNAQWVTWLNPKSVDLSTCRVKPKQKHPMKIGDVGAARLHGVVPPDSFAMPGGQPAPPPIPEITTVRPAAVKESELAADEDAVKKRTAKPAKQRDDSATSGQLMVEQRLKALYDLGYIDTDPGIPDNVNDPQTQAAVKDFQKRNKLAVDGIAGKRTKPVLKRVYEDAIGTRAGKHYLATGLGVRDGGETGDQDPEPGVVALYWRHGSARPGDRVEVRLRAYGMDNKSFSIKLRNGRTGAVTETGVTVSMVSFQGRATVTVPADTCEGATAAVELIAIADGAGETEAPLYVRPPA